MAEALKKRSEMDPQFQWDLRDLIPTEKALEELFSELESGIGRYEGFKGRLGEDAAVLKEYLDHDVAMDLKFSRLLAYAIQKRDEDTSQSASQALLSRAQLLLSRAMEASSFAEPELLGIPEPVMKGFLEDGALSGYRLYLERILARKEHMLGEREERLLAGFGQTAAAPSAIFTMFSNADVRFQAVRGGDGEEIPVTHGSYGTLMESRDRSLRQAVFHSYYSSYRQFSNTLAAAYEGHVKQACFTARARNYSSSREMSLAANEVPEQVYDSLLETIGSRLPALHRYVRLRKERLGLPELHMYDLFVPLAGGTDKRYPYEEGKRLILEGLKPLGEEYGKLLETGFSSRWIDVYENQGKRSGGYSRHVYGCHPYVLMSYTDSLDSVLTLAHEMGHSLHSWYSDHAQPPAYAGYTIFVAEVASTCNEVILFQHMIRQAETREEKESLIFQLLDRFRSVMFRQTMFAEFEWETHKMCRDGIPLTADALCSLYHGLNEKYFGPDMCVDPEIDVEWARIPHFYYTFYVYQYATAFAAAVTIGQRIFDGDKNALEGYFNFLKGGSSMKPTELLKLCGLDMEGPGVVNAALDVFESLLGSLE